VGGVIRLDARVSRWSLAALVAAVLGGALDAALIASQADVRHLVWPLILLPVAFVPAPLAVPTRAVRIVSALAMVGWCTLTGFSLGPAFVPCALLMLVATRDEL
jgi:MFS-type transporter involved in bile tolerance (Atg22 family)